MKKPATPTPGVKTVSIPGSALVASVRLHPSETPLPSPALHTAYRIHWRTDLRWRSLMIDYFGHVDYDGALTPEAAMEKFAEDFPARAPLRIEAR